MATVKLTPDFREFLKLLGEHQVEYLLIGGYAVAHYGFVRNTKDIDIWVSMRPENIQRLSDALVDFGFSPASVPPSLLAKPDTVFRMGIPPNRIEILTDISGVQFDACWPRRVDTELDGILVHVISRDDLRANKLASGRPQDLADIDRLP